MDNDRPLTPREKIERRQFWRSWSRWFSKHYGNCGEKGANAFVTAYLAWLKFLGIWTALNNLIQLLKALVLISKFCNGLTGVSLTDSVTAPAI